MARKFAVCVGINDYPGSQNDLSGCVNDARDWQDLLTKAGYTASTLIDSEATKAAVVQLLEGLVHEARFGDRIVFTYSGHGSWVPDADGDEADGRDEAIVLYDFMSGGLLLDDEINEIFSKRRFGVRVTIFSDSCFSGSVYKFVEVNPSEDTRRKRRFMPPSVFLDPKKLETASKVRHKDLSSRTTTALISGCSDLEYSYDAWINGRANGAFTHFAIQAYKQGTTLKSWYNRIRWSLPSQSYPQTPQLNASAWQRTWKL